MLKTMPLKEKPKKKTLLVFVNSFFKQREKSNQQYTIDHSLYTYKFKPIYLYFFYTS